MKLKGCSTSHFIWSIRDGMVKKVHNMDSYGMPGLKFKKLEDIFRAADAGENLKFRNNCNGARFDRNRSKSRRTCLQFADRKTKSRDSDSIEDDGPECPSDENDFEEMTLTQIKKKCKTKKRKASESVLLTPKPEDDDSDLSEPLAKFMVKVSKISKSKKHAMGSFSTPSITALSVKSELVTDIEDSVLSTKDLSATITVKAETPESEYSECGKMTCVVDDSLICNEPVGFIAPDSGFKSVNHEPASSEHESFTNPGETFVNDISLNSLDHTKTISVVPPISEDNEEYENEEDMVGQPLVLAVSEFKNEEDINHSPLTMIVPQIFSPVTGRINAYGFSSSYPCLQNIPEQVGHPSGDQDLILTSDNGYCCMDLGQVDSCISEDSDTEVQDSLSPITNFLCLPWKSHSCSNPDGDGVSVGVDLPSDEEKQQLTSISADAETNSLNLDDHLVVSEDTSIHEEKQAFVPASADLEVKVSNHSHQTDFMRDAPETRNYHSVEQRKHPERLPSTRKVISPTSQEKLCLAMNSAELLDDMDQYKCKEKLYFGEQEENKSSSNGSDVDHESNVNPRWATQFIPNKITISSKQILKKPKNNKKDSPPKRGSPPKLSLDGPRHCRSLPRLSTGCSSIEACSESAIAFSQRQMHDIESLALKLMTELKSMKVIVEEKLLYEAYRSTSLKNEADEVKLAIKSATKTEETSRRWLSMMARDCNRFCKIMKLTEDNNAPAPAPPSASETTVQENSIQREGKKISFADEAGGKLCEVKFFENEIASVESREKQEPLLAK